MNPELQEGLFAIKPEWFDRHNAKVSLMCCGFECGDGWYPLLEALLEYTKSLDENYRRFGSDANPFDKFSVFQVKEKYGALSFYHDGGDERFQGAVDFVWHMSTRICEVCGAPGRRRPGGYIVTVCDEHAQPPKAPAPVDPQT